MRWLGFLHMDGFSLVLVGCSGAIPPKFRSWDCCSAPWCEEEVCLVFNFSSIHDMAQMEVSNSRATSISPAKGDEEVSIGLSAIQGDLVLTDKEATNIIIKGRKMMQILKSMWAVIGNDFSLRKLAISMLETTM
jgi:hypothetical protein